MSLDGAIILLGVLFLANYWRSRSVLYPPFLFCAMWILDLGIYRFNLKTFDLPHTNTLNVITFGALVFSLGGFAAMFVPRALVTARLIITRFPPRNNIVKPALLLFLACGIPVLTRNLFAMAAQGTGATVFQRARTGGAEGGADLGFGGFLGTYFMLWSLYAAPLFMLERRDKKFWCMTVIAFLASVLSTGRLPILMLASSLTCVYLMTTNRHRFWNALKAARVPIFLFFCLYIGLIFVVKDLSYFEGGIVTIAILFLVSYIIGPTAAFDYSMQHPQDYVTASNHTFKFFLGIASHLHLVSYQPPPHDDFLSTLPFPTNVFTVYRFYIADFGVYGAMVMFLLYGFFQTLLYRKARTGSMLGIYFFAVSLYVIVLSPFSDEFASYGAYIDMVAFGAIYIYLRSLPLRVLPRLPRGYGAGGPLSGAYGSTKAAP
ncbi:MAG: O-antigen polymerase [Acidobacteriaceae bacterium]